MSTEFKLYWEDFQPGPREAIGSVRVEKDEVVAFANRYDVTIENVQTAEENVSFKIPRSLRAA